MKIFLRILGFFAILLIAFAIYIATKPTSYDVKRTQLIKAPTAVIFSTINEYKTWVDWGPWKKQDPSIIPTYPEKTSGVGAAYFWTSTQDVEGRMETLSLVENKSINQKIYFDRGDNSEVYWDLNYTEKGTEVTWGMKGDLDFMGKAYFMFMGGAEKMLGQMFDDGLVGLDTYVQEQINKYSITNSGVVEYGGGYYIHLTTECSFDEMPAKLDIMLPEVLIYAMQKNYPRAGDIFTLYHKYDEKNKRVEFSSCIPVKERVNPDGDIALAFMERGRYHKTSLQGAYKYSQEAWQKAFEFAKADGVVVPENGKPFEVYTKGHTDSPNPADWITEIYLPIE